MSARATLAARKNRQSKPGRTRGISEDEVKDVKELATPRTPVIYEVVRRLGQEEMECPPDALWWSGVAAGLSIGQERAAGHLYKAISGAPPIHDGCQA